MDETRKTRLQKRRAVPLQGFADTPKKQANPLGLKGLCKRLQPSEHLSNYPARTRTLNEGTKIPSVANYTTG